MENINIIYDVISPGIPVDYSSPGPFVKTGPKGLEFYGKSEKEIKPFGIDAKNLDEIIEKASAFFKEKTKKDPKEIIVVEYFSGKKGILCY